MSAGQNAPYVEELLSLFENNQRANDRGRLMRTVVWCLTPEEIRAVARYVASMH